MKILYGLWPTFLLLFPSLSLAFQFTFDPIDAVIPCHEKDKVTIDLVIEGIRKNVKNVRRIIVVSASKLTDQAEWFDERNFPFTKESVAYEIFKNNKEAEEYINDPKNRIGWIFQQFLKVYSMFVIPDISSNVLIVDADTIFLRPVEFQDSKTGAGLYNPGTEYHAPYFTHLSKVLPGFKKIFPKYSGISHHMLFQRSVLEELFTQVIQVHGQEPWKVYCAAIDKKELPGSCMCVEYEFYFNFVFEWTNLVKIRPLKWANLPFNKFNAYKDKGYDYLSCHAYLGR